MNMVRLNMLFSCCMLCITNLLAQQPAFPGAEGSGRYAVGGRGGTVYEVTNLNNSGTGSIVDAVSQPNRTVVFKVSGTISLGDVILEPKSNITIAGQTAPGDGICIKGRIHIGNSASNIIIRYIRVRVDEGAKNASGDAIDIDSGNNIIVDHVTASYSRDEGISCQPTSNFVTVQWCIISEALTYESHSYGSLIRGDYGDKKTYHHNLYAHNNSRGPRPGNYTMRTVDTLGLFFDFRNNVVYNWKGSQPGYNADTGSISRYNFIGNCYITGPESSVSNLCFKEDDTYCTAYFADNSYNGTVLADQWSLVNFNGFTADEKAAYKARSVITSMEPVTTTSAAQAKIDVLASAGASKPNRDTIDRRIVNDVLTQKGSSISTTANQPEGAWPALASGIAPADSDHDGMADDWERANGLNPLDATDRNTVGSDGYTMLEKYLHSLTLTNTTDVAEQSAEKPGCFALRQNYPNPFNPSTIIEYTVAAPGRVSLKVFDVLGKEIVTLADGIHAAGNYKVSFDASGFSNGIYFYQIKSSKFVETKKMLLLK